VALSLAALLGARPFFIDPAEFDAATAAVATLPALLAPALMSLSTRQPGWRDARRLTGTTFARATALIDDAAPLLSPASLILQRDHLLPRLEAMQAELAEWRALIEAGTGEALEQRLHAANRSHDDWLSARRKGDWGAEEMSPAPPVEGPGMLERMFGLGRRRTKSSSR
jgi:prephenate dehydrogenase